MTNFSKDQDKAAEENGKTSALPEPHSNTITSTDHKEVGSVSFEKAALEYTTLLENMRHYHDHRFKQLTLWSAITAVLVTTAYGKIAITDKLIFIVKLLGIVVSVSFFIMDLRVVDHWRHFFQRVKQLESFLGFEQFLTRPKRRLFSSTYATRLLYLFIMIFWICSLLL